MKSIDNFVSTSFCFTSLNFKHKIDYLINKIISLINSYGFFILGATLGGAIASFAFSSSLPLVTIGVVMGCSLLILLNKKNSIEAQNIETRQLSLDKLKQSIVEEKETKSQEISIPSISQMSPSQLNGFSAEKWMQNRGLFKQHTSNQGLFYYGGYNYNECLDTRTEAKNRIFINTLSNLKEDDIYLDVGAGNAYAIREFRNEFPNGARVIGVSLHPPSSETIDQVRKLDETDPKFSYYLCDFLNFPTSNLENKVSSISDVISAFRYGRKPAKFMQKVGKLLKEGGTVFIKYTVADGIKIPYGYRLCCGSKYASSYLLRFWFHTIRGFDVIQADMDLNESRAYQQEIIKDIDNVLPVERFDRHAIVLRRNSDPVEVDTLTIDPEADAKCPKLENGGMHWDYWAPKYTWQMSDYSRSMLKNPEKERLID